MKDWLEYIKDITPLKNKGGIVVSVKKIKKREAQEIYVDDVRASNGVDGATKRKFVKEKFEVSKTLDLHGYTYDTAFDAVINFVKRAYKNQDRCVLIITGKGEVLRDALPKWLENKEIKNLILETRQPSQALGGSGAFMLLIKRIRS